MTCGFGSIPDTAQVSRRRRWNSETLDNQKRPQWKSRTLWSACATWRIMNRWWSLSPPIFLQYITRGNCAVALKRSWIERMDAVTSAVFGVCSTEHEWIRSESQKNCVVRDDDNYKVWRLKDQLFIRKQKRLFQDRERSEWECVETKNKGSSK